MTELKKFTLWFLIILVFSLVSKNMSEDIRKVKQINYPEFLEEIKSGNIKEVIIHEGNIIKGYLKQINENKRNISFKTIGNTGDVTVKILNKHGIIPNYVKEERPLFTSIIINWGPLIVIIVIIYFFLKEINSLKRDIVKKLNITKKEDNDNLLKEPDNYHNDYHIYTIRFDSFEINFVREAILLVKKKT